MSGYGKGAEAKRRKGGQLAAQEQARQIAPLQFPPAPPAHLGDSGRHVWLVVMEERFKTLTAAEVHIVERYCELQDRRVELKGILSRDGWSVPGSRPGMVVIHPAATVIQSTELELRQMERILGLGPAYRARLAIDLIAVEDGLDTLADRRSARQVAASEGADDPRLREPVDADIIDDDG